jgi:hypothetical protein
VVKTQILQRRWALDHHRDFIHLAPWMPARGCETVGCPVASVWCSELPQRARPSARPSHPQLTLRMEGLAQTLAIGPPMSTAPRPGVWRHVVYCMPAAVSLDHSLPALCKHKSVRAIFIPSTPAPQKTRRVLSLSDASQRCFLSHLIFSTTPPACISSRITRSPHSAPA